MTREELGTICERFQVSLASAGFRSPGFPSAFSVAPGAGAIADDAKPSARRSRSRPCCAMAPSPFILQPTTPASTPAIQTDSFVARIEPPRRFRASNAGRRAGICTSSWRLVANR
jgi:hypothetical protein